jgi:hypothetical protein
MPEQLRLVQHARSCSAEMVGNPSWSSACSTRRFCEATV